MWVGGGCGSCGDWTGSLLGRRSWKGGDEGAGLDATVREMGGDVRQGRGGRGGEGGPEGSLEKCGGRWSGHGTLFVMANGMVFFCRGVDALFFSFLLSIVAG